MKKATSILVITEQRSLILSFFLVLGISLISQGLAILAGLLIALLYTLKNKTIKLNSITILLTAFLFVNLIFGFINGSNLSLLLEEILRNFAFILIYTVIIKKLDNESIDSLIEIFSKLVICTLILYPILMYHGRFTSIFPHPNHLAYACNLMIAYILLVRGARNITEKTTIGLLLLLILLSNSSGGIISTCLTLLLYNFRKSIPKFLIVSIFIAILIWVLKDTQPLSLIFEKFNSVNLGEIESRSAKRAFGNDTSLVWRITYWYAIIDSLLHHPTWNHYFGLGIGTMSYPNYYFHWMITDPHNDYVRKIAEIGFLGATIYFTIWYLIIRKMKTKLFIFSIFLIPMLVGNMIVNVTFMLLLFLFIERSIRSQR
ncbi:O-antigen ligase family protein [Alteromonas sp. C1M14]|uniref:O-antigen ligase family protein n=1 Tax=Alteromonas sp. C1M14 TaxID=2841567 RepID=UPI001C0A1FF9|nr:O-antigen ligase family protein [Alteromonas sp. C1M14]MBU2979947.1 O-antigen ligase family protein [Alteromonas sp. C1M14]